MLINVAVCDLQHARYLCNHGVFFTPMLHANPRSWVCGLPELLPETCLYFFLEVGPKVRPRTTKVATAVLLTRANLEA